MSERFWIVWCPERGLPRVQHDTEAEAVAEAQRVAGLERRKVYVCECIGNATPQDPPVVWTDIRIANATLQGSPEAQRKEIP